MDKISEKKLLLEIIGILEALQNNSITIIEAEEYIFSPRNVKKLSKKECDNRILKIIEECCELEDIESIIPHKFCPNIKRLKLEALDILTSYS